jgi:hypothetical protein
MAAEGRDVHVRPPLHLCHRRLLDAQGLDKHLLGQTPGIPQIAKRHFSQSLLKKAIVSARASGLIFASSSENLRVLMLLLLNFFQVIIINFVRPYIHCME